MKKLYTYIKTITIEAESQDEADKLLQQYLDAGEDFGGDWTLDPCDEDGEYNELDLNNEDDCNYTPY